MKAKELIRKLEQLGEDAEVMVAVDERGYRLKEIEGIGYRDDINFHFIRLSLYSVVHFDEDEW